MGTSFLLVSLKLHKGVPYHLLHSDDYTLSIVEPWLEQNVEDPDPLRPERVQAIVDQELVWTKLVPLENVEATTAGSERANEPLIELQLEGGAGPSLSEFVAKEKARGIERQRPAICALGAKKLAELVRAIFDNLVSRKKTEEDLASEYGLSKAALSRFAGSRWTRQPERKGMLIPDLWVNMAHVLACQSEFTELARRTGLLEFLREIAETNPSPRLRSNDHDR